MKVWLFRLFIVVIAWGLFCVLTTPPVYFNAWWFILFGINFLLSAPLLLAAVMYRERNVK